MTTHNTVVLAAAVVVLSGGVCANAQTAVGTTRGWRPPSLRPASTLPHAGWITSVVRDASGAPVSGAIVSAVGGRTLIGTTDAKGRCTLAAPGRRVLVRVHRAGFGTSHSLIVHVTAGTEAAHDVVLTLARNGPGPKRRTGRRIRDPRRGNGHRRLHPATGHRARSGGGGT